MKTIVLGLALTLFSAAGHAQMVDVWGADLVEAFCRKERTRLFDAKVKNCERLVEKYKGDESALLRLNDCPWKYHAFVPTSKLPNMATYREYAIEIEIAKCMVLPSLITLEEMKQFLKENK